MAIPDTTASTALPPITASGLTEVGVMAPMAIVGINPAVVEDLLNVEVVGIAVPWETDFNGEVEHLSVYIAAASLGIKLSDDFALKIGAQAWYIDTDKTAPTWHLQPHLAVTVIP